MIQFLLAATLLIAPSWAAPKPKAKSRTIQQLIELTLKGGGRKKIPVPMAANLGFDGDVHTKVISYSANKTPDKREHQFYVVFDKDQKEPIALVWGNTFASGKNPTQTVDGYKYRTTLAGDLVKAVHTTGIVGEVTQIVQDASLKEIRAAFAKERQFFLIDAIRLD